VKLESSIDQWTAYDREYETLHQWLKDTEAQVRNEATLKPDLPTKIQQLEQFKVGNFLGLMIKCIILTFCI